MRFGLRGVGGLGGVGEFSVCGISTYKQVKFLGKILQHCCGNSFSFLKWSGRGQGSKWSVQEGTLDNGQ